MALTTAAPSVDPVRLRPGLAPYARTTVRLHPRRGTPGVTDSHLGGPLYWPAGEPWPHCADHRDVNGRPLGPYPMAAVAQLTAADFPEIPFPAGTDLVQVLWCTDWHDQPHPEGWGQSCRVFWRRTAEITAVREPSAGEPGTGDAHDEDMVPRPCVLRPERMVEYPWYEELPGGLGDGLGEWYEEVSTVPGCKLGGAMGWATTDLPAALDCGDCGRPLALFLQFDTYEFLGGHEPDRWWPLEERHLVPGTAEFTAAREPTGMTVGRGGHAGLFLCSADPTHPPSFFTQ
ncbi:YwqG family protein [Streptomyces cucumeris]|uniref:YwqG family protein n=1 Tax=Streptomyces cucumeris TaxID=2962890 RepID=UPI0020C868B7|nr:YwqG family protein [Streptomyces sp. NEAU-Y11]MCP9209126.1 YwqG family protein [Streptomyces sp. NEAU-Y11]